MKTPITTEQFNGASTCELASLVKWRVTDIHKRMTPLGYFYHCKLNGQLVRVTEARAMIIGRIEADGNQLP